jgi:hypothetical protein
MNMLKKIGRMLLVTVAFAAALIAARYVRFVTGHFNGIPLFYSCKTDRTETTEVARTTLAQSGFDRNSCLLERMDIPGEKTRYFFIVPDPASQDRIFEVWMDRKRNVVLYSGYGVTR